MDYYQMVEEAWSLSEAALEHVKSAGDKAADVDLWTQVFSRSPLVDLEKTKKEGGKPLAKIFLKSLYGLQYRVDFNDWIPFRHGAVDFSKDPELK